MSLCSWHSRPFLPHLPSLVVPHFRRASLHLGHGGLLIRPSPMLGLPQVVWALAQSTVPPSRPPPPAPAKSCSFTQAQGSLILLHEASLIASSCGIHFFLPETIGSYYLYCLFGTKSSTVIWHNFGVILPRCESLLPHLPVVRFGQASVFSSMKWGY